MIGARKWLIFTAGMTLLAAVSLWLVIGTRLFGERHLQQLVAPEGAPRLPLHYRAVLPGEAGPETDASVFGYISDMTVDGEGNIYIADGRRHRIMKFDSTGKFILQIGRPGQGPGELLAPSGIDVDDRGFVYVLDVGNSRVQIYTPEGRYHGGFLVTPHPAGGMDQKIAVDNGGKVYLSLPRTGHLITVFSEQGEKLRQFGAIEHYPTLWETIIFNKVIIRIDRAAAAVHVVFPKTCIYRKYSTDGRLLFSKRIQSSWMRSRLEELTTTHEARVREGNRTVKWVEFLRSACVLPDHSLVMSVLVKWGDRELCQFSPQGHLIRRFFVSPAEADTVSLDCLAAFRGSSIRIAFADRFLGLIGLLEKRR